MKYGIKLALIFFAVVSLSIGLSSCQKEKITNSEVSNIELMTLEEVTELEKVIDQEKFFNYGIQLMEQGSDIDLSKFENLQDNLELLAAISVVTQIDFDQQSSSIGRTEASSSIYYKVKSNTWFYTVYYVKTWSCPSSTDYEGTMTCWFGVACPGWNICD